MNLSRRGFLFGLGATAITAAVAPAVLAAVPPVPIIAAPVVPIKPFPYTGPYYYLHPAQWKFFESEGFNMNLCKLIEPIPTTPKVRRGKRKR